MKIDPSKWLKIKIQPDYCNDFERKASNFETLDLYSMFVLHLTSRLTVQIGEIYKSFNVFT